MTAKNNLDALTLNRVLLPATAGARHTLSRFRRLPMFELGFAYRQTLRLCCAPSGRVPAQKGGTWSERQCLLMRTANSPLNYGREANGHSFSAQVFLYSIRNGRGRVVPLAALLSSRSSISTSRTRSNKGAQRFYTSGRIDALPTRRGVDATLMGRSLSPQPARGHVGSQSATAGQKPHGAL